MTQEAKKKKKMKQKKKKKAGQSNICFLFCKILHEGLPLIHGLLSKQEKVQLTN